MSEEATAGWWDRPIEVTPRLIACALIGFTLGRMLWKLTERVLL